LKEIYSKINDYYSKKIAEFGATPQGVDWNGDESQLLRFNILSKILPTAGFSLADVGCGYGSYAQYLDKNYDDFDYLGFDFSDGMISAAKKENKKNINFHQIKRIDEIGEADFAIASGIFNVKLDFDETIWLEYINTCLHEMSSKARRGFAVNFLTSYSDEALKRPDLYYADPGNMFNYCKMRFSKNVALLHDYDLYEFTILVRK
jgi:SAM-dependent methyltransferase